MKENKIKIKLGVIGYLPFGLNRKKIKNFKSDIFEIVGEIDDYHRIRSTNPVIYFWR